ncbi:MAG: biotin--[acetyl-CoA-carboxylase] ligase [Firmicutes bacterium]|nr:biotin--[acetyl-CoA-carboxylase] ligase [Bacillota bacterium]
MIGSKILRFDVLESTNDFAKLNYESLDQGTIVIATKQTKGRGRNNKTWKSDQGNLYFSIVLKEDISLKRLFRYVSITSLAMVHVLDNCGIKASIKYPNDILVNQKKIAGILIESAGNLTNLNYVIIGVGINVNQTSFNELSERATSFRLETEKQCSVDRVLLQFIHHYNMLSEAEYQNVYDDYISKSIVLGKKITYDDEEYTIRSIDMDGVINLENGLMKKRVVMNEISLEELYD